MPGRVAAADRGGVRAARGGRGRQLRGLGRRGDRGVGLRPVERREGLRVPDFELAFYTMTTLL